MFARLQPGRACVSKIFTIGQPNCCAVSMCRRRSSARTRSCFLFCVIAIDKKLDDPVGALTAHGLCGIWGTLSCGLFTSPRLAVYNTVGDPAGGLVYSGSFTQMIAQVAGLCVAFSFVFAASYATFLVIKKVYGLRVSEEEEDAGLDISEHGMYGYPEAFIPAAELIGYGGGPTATVAPAPVPTLATKESPA